MAMALMLMVLLSTSCTKDKGNYDYRDICTAEIDPFPPDLTVEQFTNFYIEPKMTLSDPRATFNDFEYVWYLYPENSQYIYSIDTISRERILDIPISYVIGNYYLGFKVINKETKTYNEIKTLFRVINEDNIGYILLSSINGEAETTFVSEKGNITRGIVETLNGRKIGKNPVGLHVTQGIYMNNYLVWILCDDEEAGGGLVLNATSLSIFRTYEQMFMFKPDKIKPQVVAWDGASPFLEATVNNGVLYSRWDRAPYPPEFGDPKTGDFYVDNFLFCWDTYWFFAYDKLGKRFLWYNNIQQLDLQIFPDPEPEDAWGFDPRNVGMDMLEGYMCGPAGATKWDGRAVMRDDNGDVNLLNFTLVRTYPYPMAPGNILNVSSHPGINQAKAFAITVAGEFAYYGEGNKIHISSFITGNYLGVMQELPAGLTIDCLRVDRKRGRSELWVAASNGSGSADSGSFFVFGISSDGTLTKKAEYLNCCGRVVDIHFKD